MISSSSSDGQKKCNCKKSRCLKLYCECFAAGFYCDESCSCQDCFNSRDYEDTVDETRKQIELRNPLAFSSKIHSHSVVEDGDKPIPIAGKHKKGCNCKKSMCVKRYCECYQANVGCSDECRCEGCKNAFGKKEGYNVYNESTSWTPSQYLGHGEDTSATRFFTGCYIPTPESANNDMMIGTSNVEFMNHFTPPDTIHINAWPNSSRASGNVSSVTSLSWPSSLVTPIPLFDGPKADGSNEKPIDTIDENMPNE